jgi:hypothetical protein
MKKRYLLILTLILLPLVAFSQVGPISFSSTEIDDDNERFAHDNSQGDGNHQIAAGELIRLSIKLKNDGTQIATSVIAKISCDNVNVIFSDAEEEYKDIDAGSIAEPYSFFAASRKDGGFLFSVLESCPSTTVHFTLDITASNCGPFEQSFDLQILGGTVGPITMADFYTDDDNYNIGYDKSQGDGNGKLDPGETIGLNLVLMNNGTIPAIGYSAKMRVNYPGITVLDSVLGFSVVRAGSKAWPDYYEFGSQFHFSIADDIVPDTVNFSIDIYNSTNNVIVSFPILFPIEKPGTVLLELSSVDFDDDQENFTNPRVIGNGNKIMEPRETIEVTADIKNNGTGSALEVKAILHNNSPFLTMVDSVEEFESIRGGQSASPDGWGDDMSFMVKIMNTAPTGNILCPVEIITKTAAVFYDTLTIPVDASNSPQPGTIVILRSPDNGEVSDDAIITVKGYVDDPLTRVFLNGDSIGCENNAFEGYLLNRRGDNFITIRAIDSEGKEDSVTVKVIGEPTNSFSDKMEFFLHNKSAGKIPYDFLSECAPHNTTSEYTYYGSTPDSTEWIYPLDSDIEGNSYTFSLLLSSLSSTLYDCKIIVRRNSDELVVASAEFNVPGYDRYESTVAGIDPSTTNGDTLVFRLCWNRYANFWLSKYFSDPFGGSLDASYIYLPLLPTSVKEVPDSDAPADPRLIRNYPNPFSEYTTITYELKNEDRISLEILDINGNVIMTLFDGVQAQGRHQFRWDATNNNGEKVCSGVYYCILRSNQFIESNKIIFYGTR